jgi:hypothetical protein
MVLYEGELLKHLERHSIGYVIVPKAKNFLTLYFGKAPYFTLLKEIGDGKIKIYKYKNIKFKPEPYFDTAFGRGAWFYVRDLYEKDRSRYDSTKERLLFDHPSENMRAFFDLIEKNEQSVFFDSYQVFDPEKVY